MTTAKPERVRHPAVSDIAMALATRQRPEKSTKVTITDANAKLVPQITVEVIDPDPDEATKAFNIYDAARARYPLANGVEQYQAEVRRLQDERKKP